MKNQIQFEEKKKRKKKNLNVSADNQGDRRNHGIDKGLFVCTL